MIDERNLTLTKREEGVREKKRVEIVEFDLDEIFQQFNENITSIKKKFEIADKLIEENNEESCRDILRSQIVFLDSALDYYLHCITKYGMNKIFNGEWEKTEKYKKFMVPLQMVEHAIKNKEDTSWFSKLINDTYADATFMNYDSFNSQLKLIGIEIKDIANDVYYSRESTQKPSVKLKEFINKLFHRRNRIAHQSDRLHENGEKQEITKVEVTEYIDAIEKIVNSIQNRINDKNSAE